MAVRPAVFWITVAVVAALVVGREWIGPADTAPATIPGGRAHAATPARPHAPRPAIAAGSGAGTAPPHVRSIASSAALAHGFNTAPSLRAFVYDALKKPEEGGYLYAFAVLGYCKYDGTELAGAPAASARQREAAEALTRRCDMAAAERQDVRRQIAAARRDGFDSDPYLAFSFELLMAHDAESKRKVIADLFGTGDIASLTMLDHEINYAQDGRALRGVYFAGRHYPGEDGNGMFGYALLLAQCRMGLECGAQSLPLLALCIQKGWCGDSVAQALRAGLGPEQGATYAQVEALASRLVQEIKRGNAAAFVNPQ